MIREHDINYGYDYDSVLDALALAYTENLALQFRPISLARVREIRLDYQPLLGKMRLMSSVRRFGNWMGDKPEYPHKRVP